MTVDRAVEVAEAEERVLDKEGIEDEAMEVWLTTALEENAEPDVAETEERNALEGTDEENKAELDEAARSVLDVLLCNVPCMLRSVMLSLVVDMPQSTVQELVSIEEGAVSHICRLPPS